MLNAYAREPDPSKFGIVNALTRAAGDYDDAERRYGLERLASQVLNLNLTRSQVSL